MLLRTDGRDLDVRVVATGLDGTLLGPDGQPDREAVALLAALRGASVRTVLATRRSAREVEALALDGCFDAYVLEGGAVVAPTLRQAKGPPEPWVAAALERLRGMGIEAEAHQASLSLPAEAADAVRADPVFAACGWQAAHGRILLTQNPVDKRLGLQRALDAWPPGDRAALLAFVDAADDLPLVAAAEASVAPLDAEPGVLGATTYVTGPAGTGVGDFLSVWLETFEPAPRQEPPVDLQVAPAGDWPLNKLGLPIRR